MFCIYKTDPDWIASLRTVNPDIQVNFWRKGVNALKLPLGSWFYFNQRRTKYIVGRGILVGYEVMPVREAWESYGGGNGVSSLEELELRAAEVLNIRGENPQIGCILLSELQFLEAGREYTVSIDDYSPNIVSAKYFEDTQLLDLQNAFSDAYISSHSVKEKQPKTYNEGKEQYSYRVGYERNPEARKACLAHHGFKCKACGVLLEDIYGSIARDLIHVHHIKQMAHTDGEQEVNPITDMVPLCPNCHTVVHRKVPPFTVDELRVFIGLKNETK